MEEKVGVIRVRAGLVKVGEAVGAVVIAAVMVGENVFGIGVDIVGVAVGVVGVGKVGVSVFVVGAGIASSRTRRRNQLVQIFPT